MKRIIDFIFAGGLILTISGAFQKTEKPDTIFYVSLNKAIKLGQYEGVLALDELLQRGDFGVGSEEKLKSEVVILDGVAYGIMADGNLRTLSMHTQIPFATTKFFVADTTMTMDHKVSFKEFKRFLDSIVAPNSFAALKVTADFRDVKYRSFYKQEKPYKPLKEALFKKFERKKTRGTLVGFFTPKSLEILNSPDYHLHFIDEAKTTGGHLLDAEMDDLHIQIDFAQDLFIKLPAKDKLSDIDLNKTPY